MSNLTKYLQLSIPDENKDPHYDELVALFNGIDDSIFGVMNTAGNVVIPPDGLLWTIGIKQLSWTGEFKIRLLTAPYSITIPFGPDAINKYVYMNSGDRIIITVPRIAAGDLIGTMSVISGTTPILPGMYVLGLCEGNKFYPNFSTAL